MDLNKIVNEKMKELKESGYVEERVEHHLKQTVDSVLKDCLESWSSFGKGLKEEVKNQLAFDLEKLDIPSYNQMILNTVKGELERTLHEDGVKQIEAGIQEMLGTAQKEYKLSKMVEEMVQQDLELDELEYDELSEVTVIVKEEYSSIYIYMDPKEDVSWYQCKYRVKLNKDGTVWGVEVNEVDFDNKLIMGGLYGFDKMLFQLYTRKPKVIIDNYETSFSNPEYDN